MDEFEKKLQTYRIQEKRKRQIEQVKNILLKPVKFYREDPDSSEFAAKDGEEEFTGTLAIDQMQGVNSDTVRIVNDEGREDDSFSWKKFLMNLFVWCCFFRYAVYIEFGAVFLLLSGFYLIWINTRTGPKKIDELSAYSVFNPNCERIEGTLDAEQFEKEIRYGMII